MTPQAKFSAGIDGHGLNTVWNTVWMIYGGSMTVFALDSGMDRAAV
jgi:hypothetical protein